MGGNDHLEREVEALRKEVQENGVRLNLAQGWIEVLRQAYDALLHWGVNFKSLKEYEGGYPEGAEKLPISQAQVVYSKWFMRLRHSIEAMVRRRQFKVHENPPTDTLQ